MDLFVFIRVYPKNKNVKRFQELQEEFVAYQKDKNKAMRRKGTLATAFTTSIGDTNESIGTYDGVGATAKTPVRINVGRTVSVRNS